MTKHPSEPNGAAHQNVGVRYVMGSISLLLCAFAAISSVRTGLSRLMSEYGAAVRSTEAAQRALDFNTADPEAHYVYASQLSNGGQTDFAVAEFERAAALRPQDYFLWQELGRAREDNSDVDGAVIALRQAIELAPAYAQPHWQLGNVLLRKGVVNEAFREMRRAATNDPTLFPVMCDLAWGLFDENADAVTAAIQPQTDDERVSLARLFVAHDQIVAAVNLLNACAKVGAEDRRAIVNRLIEAHDYQAAYKIWSVSANFINKEELLFDGGFETSINADEGFGWRLTPAQTIRTIFDPNDPYSGRRSLRLDYLGNFNPAVPIMSQLVPVSPRARYRLSFATRTEDLISAGLPIVVVQDAAEPGRLLTQSVALPPGTNHWKESVVEFETPGSMKAITINIQRQTCPSNPCPIFGRAWFDSFSLTYQ